MSIVRNDLEVLKGVEGGFSITPNDATDLPRKTKAIMVGTAGNLRVTMANGNVVTWPSLAAGLLHPIQAIKVWSTGTTAVTIVGGV